MSGSEESRRENKVSPETNKTWFPSSRRLVRALIPVAGAVVLFGLLVWPGLAYNFSNNIRLSTIGPLDAANPDITAAADYYQGMGKCLLKERRRNQWLVAPDQNPQRHR
jgi:hypothetical protein